MIPKVIHYCWFGGTPLPESAQRCIASWKKHCPDYKIIRWDENNFDINCCPYVSEAYEAGNWAFVSDYARFAILYDHGGVYFDTDVELIRPIDDILDMGPFMGCEQYYEKKGSKYSGRYARRDGACMVAPGLGMAAPKGFELYGEVLEYYGRIHYLNADGTKATVVMHITNLLRKDGFNMKNEMQCVRGVNIYPVEYFCPLDPVTREINITENTRSIHHYDASWLSETARRDRNARIFWEGKGRVGAAFYRVIRPFAVVAYKIQEIGLIGTIRFMKNKMRRKEMRQS